MSEESKEKSSLLYRLELIAEIVGASFGRLTLQEQFSQHALRICEAMGTDACVVRRLEEDDLELIASWGLPKDRLYPRLKSNYGIGKDLINSKKPIAIDDVFTDPRTAQLQSSSYGYSFRSYAGAPMMLQGEVIGLLGVYSVQRKSSFDEIDLAQLQLIANHLAVVMNNYSLNQQLNELNQSLENRVEQRTTDLEAANRELVGFTYMVSHDLRAPLRAVMANSMILLEELGGSLPSEASTALLKQAKAAKKLGVLIDDLLQLSRLSRDTLVIQECDLSSLAAEVINELIQADLNIEAEVEIAPDLICFADPRLLRFLLQNIIQNAFKFKSLDRTPKVIIGSIMTEKGDAFYVKDNGVGFNETYADKIFLPFERLVRDADYTGTGIGLANVKRIVDRHKGQVWAESKTEEGATFFFTLAQPKSVASNLL